MISRKRNKDIDHFFIDGLLNYPRFVCFVVYSPAVVPDGFVSIICFSGFNFAGSHSMISFCVPKKYAKKDVVDCILDYVSPVLKKYNHGKS